MSAEERIKALRTEADRLESAACTGLAATWCPVHGDCTCPRSDNEHDPYPDGMNDDACPLHSRESSHAESSLA